MDRRTRPNFKAANHYPMKRRHWPITVFILLAISTVWDCDWLAAADAIQTAGDVLQIVLPATAAGLTIGYHDGHGALQLGESLAVTLGITYALKYSIDAKRPN